jgi:hypothetical protein
VRDRRRVKIQGREKEQEDTGKRKRARRRLEEDSWKMQQKEDWLMQK